MPGDSLKGAPRIFPVLLFLIALPLVLGGVQLVFLGGSFYYLLAGLALLACAMRVWRRDPMAAYIYGGLLVATIAWSLLEAGTNLWALAPRILPMAVVGTWFLTPWYRKVVYRGNPPPLMASKQANGVAAVVILITAYVVAAGSGFDVNSMAPRSGVNT
ncbi:MAG: hypothetical protein RL120_16075, partial [Gammaproteobacteria bacterium]